MSEQSSQPVQAIASLPFKKITIEIDGKNPTMDGVIMKVDGQVIENLRSFDIYGYCETYGKNLSVSYATEPSPAQPGTLQQRSYFRLTPQPEKCEASLDQVPVIDKLAPKANDLRAQFAAIGCGPTAR